MTRNADQQAFWTSVAGPKWVDHQEAMDMLMQPVLEGLFERAALPPGARVLDIGCGTGASSLQAAEIVGQAGQVLGADISSSLLALARSRAAGRSNIGFVEGDAAEHTFAQAHHDHLVSRFGVMFFADPAAAFANMARALKPGAKMTFAAWGQIPHNPFFTVPAQAARALLGPVPKSDPDGPGPFAFRDPDRVLSILRSAGLTDCAVDVVPVDLTPQGTPQNLARQTTAIGPAEAALSHHQASPDQRIALEEKLVEAFRPFQTPQGLRIPAEINYVSAVVPA
ncbi:methyltransferase domain-containing protein [Aestuariivita sp.]|jgi:SAM-dependent methyltransferase|uniref:class I SAM-dependent methyltransferase n=1 Tax=Aestuariivita sp. TaxID=1872407 RepID=UPI0021711042|nr:methyltransferase domain-containing protein [Aestuariivita sp.]MCE8008222.1 methyltransferase domain-containing protein [Aestuariivita sp.]